MAYTTIDDPSAYFQAATYTGAGSLVKQLPMMVIADLQPDFLWIKREIRWICSRFICIQTEV
jgi:hypothetical protein